MNTASTSTGIAALPMYDFPNLRQQTDRLWKRIAKELRQLGMAAPAALSHHSDLWSLWQHPQLVFAQTCGYPLVSKLQNRVAVIGTPDYGVIANKPGWFNSVVLVRKDDPRDTLAAFDGAALAYNDLFSQSGCHALMYAVLRELGEKRLFEKCVCTGSHAGSILAVAAERADLAAVDAITWRHLQAALPQTRQLRILMETLPTPGLPYIAAINYDSSLMAEATESAIAALTSDDRQALGLLGLWRSDIGDYAVIRERAMQASGVFRHHGFRSGG